MKLRHQTLVLIGLPLIFELIFVGALTAAGLSLERAAANESHAKSVLTACDSLRVRLFGKGISLTSMKMTQSKDVSDAVDTVDTSNARFEALRNLVRDDGEGKVAVETYLATLEHLRGMIDEARAAYLESAAGSTFANFLTEQEYFEELAVYSKQVTRDIEKVNAVYAPIVSEFRPEAARKRTLLRSIIFAGVFLNIALSLSLALYFGKNTVARFELLTKKLRGFSKGTTDSKPIAGNDEISELDTAFRQMATERAEADEARRAIQAMVSHDLRAPLTSLVLRLDLCRNSVYGKLEPAMLSTIETIESEVRRLIRLTNDLLDVEKLEQGKLDLVMDLFDARGIIEDSINAVAVLASTRQIELIVEGPDSEQLSIYCDRARIEQVLINLLSNAIKFSPRSSQIVVSAKDEGANIRFEVLDQGQGLTESERAKVFEKFVQLQQEAALKSTGSGLGLSICKQLIELHGGTIGIDSPSVGSCFWFELKKVPSVH